mmetsp:Transcript_25459/g.71012  ORF Transcript_25459/g.71012 Transcript_25459/m.71012 type:complete len:385 (+) Transcript_25459:146-1300(+)
MCSRRREYATGPLCWRSGLNRFVDIGRTQRCHVGHFLHGHTRTHKNVIGGFGHWLVLHLRNCRDGRVIGEGGRRRRLFRRSRGRRVTDEKVYLRVRWIHGGCLRILRELLPERTAQLLIPLRVLLPAGERVAHNHVRRLRVLRELLPERAVQLILLLSVLLRAGQRGAHHHLRRLVHERCRADVLFVRRQNVSSDCRHLRVIRNQRPQPWELIGFEGLVGLLEEAAMALGPSLLVCPKSSYTPRLVGEYVWRLRILLEERIDSRHDLVPTFVLLVHRFLKNVEEQPVDEIVARPQSNHVLTRALKDLSCVVHAPDYIRHGVPVEVVAAMPPQVSIHLRSDCLAGVLLALVADAHEDLRGCQRLDVGDVSVQRFVGVAPLRVPKA